MDEVILTIVNAALPWFPFLFLMNELNAESSPSAEKSALTSWVVFAEEGRCVYSAATADEAVRALVEQRRVQPGEEVKVISWEQFNAAHAVIVAGSPSDDASVTKRLIEGTGHIYAALMNVAKTIRAPAEKPSSLIGRGDCRSFERE